MTHLFESVMFGNNDILKSLAVLDEALLEYASAVVASSAHLKEWKRNAAEDFEFFNKDFQSLEDKGKAVERALDNTRNNASSGSLNPNEFAYTPQTIQKMINDFDTLVVNSLSSLHVLEINDVANNKQYVISAYNKLQILFNELNEFIGRYDAKCKKFGIKTEPFVHKFVNQNGTQDVVSTNTLNVDYYKKAYQKLIQTIAQRRGLLKAEYR